MRSVFQKVFLFFFISLLVLFSFKSWQDIKDPTNFSQPRLHDAFKQGALTENAPTKKTSGNDNADVALSADENADENADGHEAPSSKVSGTLEPVALPKTVFADYSFMAQNPSGSPARWNPCEAVHYEVNDKYASPGALLDVKEAFSRISKATGMTFIYDGPSSAFPSRKRAEAYPPLPVLIAWMKPSDKNAFSSGVAASGGGNVIDTKGGKKYISGSVAFNTSYNSYYEKGFAAGQSRGILLMHELGHVLGLGHSHGTDSVMYETVGPESPTKYSLSDLKGFSEVGKEKGCF